MAARKRRCETAKYLGLHQPTHNSEDLDKRPHAHLIRHISLRRKGFLSENQLPEDFSEFDPGRLKAACQNVRIAVPEFDVLGVVGAGPKPRNIDELQCTCEGDLVAFKAAYRLLREVERQVLPLVK